MLEIYEPNDSFWGNLTMQLKLIHHILQQFLLYYCLIDAGV